MKSITLPIKIYRVVKMKQQFTKIKDYVLYPTIVIKEEDIMKNREIINEILDRVPDEMGKYLEVKVTIEVEG